MRIKPRIDFYQPVAIIVMQGLPVFVQIVGHEFKSSVAKRLAQLLTAKMQCPARAYDVLRLKLYVKFAQILNSCGMKNLLPNSRSVNALVTSQRREHLACVEGPMDTEDIVDVQEDYGCHAVSPSIVLSTVASSGIFQPSCVAVRRMTHVISASVPQPVPRSWVSRRSKIWTSDNAAYFVDRFFLHFATSCSARSWQNS